MFALGAVIAFVTMSVAVALTMLVPLVARGHLRRRHCIPYIMGANISTLGDTLLTAFVLGNQTAVHVVIAELVGIISITLLLLIFFYRPITEGLVAVTDWLLDRKLRMGVFVAALFTIPLTLIYMLP
jgi:Na+/phosphate symporter